MKAIKIDTEIIDVLRELAGGCPYKRWLRENKLKGNIYNAARYVVSTAGTWNTAYNSFIEEHRLVLEKIAASPEIEVRVIRKTIEIYTVGFNNK